MGREVVFSEKKKYWSGWSTGKAGGLERTFWILTFVGVVVITGVQCLAVSGARMQGDPMQEAEFISSCAILAMVVLVPLWGIGMPIAAIVRYMRRQEEKAKAWREYYQKYAEWQEQTRMQGRA